MESNDIIFTVKKWVKTMVIGLNLCPFAGREYHEGRIRYVVSRAEETEDLLIDLQKEIESMLDDDDIETTLLIHPEILKDFYEYNQFLSLADALLISRQWETIFQIASFHPDYQFHDTEPKDVENFTNKSPYPTLHILREASLDLAIDAHPDTTSIPIENNKRMRRLGAKYLSGLWRNCFAPSTLENEEKKEIFDQD